MRRKELTNLKSVKGMALAAILAMAMCASACSAGGTESETDDVAQVSEDVTTGEDQEVADVENDSEEQTAEEPQELNLAEAKVGDIITFGAYEQDGDESAKEPIEWKILAISDNKALVISDKVLDVKKYNEEKTDVTWETCSLRTWLNNDFVAEAFDDAEKEQIAEVTVTTEDNAINGADGGNDTNDKLFLLSLEEVYEYYGTSFEVARKAAPTAYAESNGVSGYDNGAYWWLRTPGSTSNQACIVNPGGSADKMYYENVDGSLNQTYPGVRPAMWLNF